IPTGNISFYSNTFILPFCQLITVMKAIFQDIIISLSPDRCFIIEIAHQKMLLTRPQVFKYCILLLAKRLFAVLRAFKITGKKTYSPSVNINGYLHDLPCFPKVRIMAIRHKKKITLYNRVLRK